MNHWVCFTCIVDHVSTNRMLATDCNSSVRHWSLSCRVSIHLYIGTLRRPVGQLLTVRELYKRSFGRRPSSCLCTWPLQRRQRVFEHGVNVSDVHELHHRCWTRFPKRTWRHWEHRTRKHELLGEVDVWGCSTLVNAAAKNCGSFPSPGLNLRGTGNCRAKMTTLVHCSGSWSLVG